MDLRATHLIGRHLPVPAGAMPTDDVCCLCDAPPGTPGWRREQVISKDFPDSGFLGPSSWICGCCAACLGYGQTRPEFLKNHSYLATHDALLRLKREEVLDQLLAPHDQPWFLAVTYAHKKHTSYRGRINLPGQERWQVATESGPVTVTRSLLDRVLPIVQRWYTVCKDTTEQPTWFSKADILTGIPNWKKVEAYGTARYLDETATLEPFRRTAALQLLVHILNKGELQ